ncbi:TPA: WG repeat-containing protein, partial [Campylobacter coli]|nr:WG repeat-containing protein [Campylobacter coli]
MLICNHCNTKNLDAAKFCKECGNSDLYDPQAEEKLEQERRLE